MIETELSKAADVVKTLEKVRGIVPKTTSAVSGPYDVITLIEGESHNAIGRVILENVQTIPGVKKTLTCLCIEVGVLV